MSSFCPFLVNARTMKNRLTFLHFLYQDSAIGDIAEARVSNNEYKTTRIIGATDKERKKILTFIYNKYCNILPYEIPIKKKSTFFMRKV